MTEAETVLEGRRLVRDYHLAGGLFGKARTVHALKGVSFSVSKGHTLAIVGESGCGKSTLARIITLIDPATSGELLIDGETIDIAKGRLTSQLRRKVQIVFQNPYGSLNPRQKIGDVLTEPLRINTDLPGDERRARAHEDADQGRARGASITAAIRICSPAASGSASRLRGR